VFRYDTLVIAVGSVTNDFGTPGASQYAVPLETPVQAMRFNRRLVNADESPTVIDGIRPRKSGSQLTPRWRGESAANSSLENAKFPASWENTGNFVRLGLRVRLLARNPASNSMAYDAIPYASEQGIYFGLAGN